MIGISIALPTAAAITTTGTRRHRRRETETGTGIGTSSAAAARALPTMTGGILRRGALLRRISGRAGGALVADMDMIIMVVMSGEQVEEVVMQMRSPMAGLGLVLQGGTKMGFLM